MAKTESGLTVPDHVAKASVRPAGQNRQQARAEARALQKRRQRWRKSHEAGVPIARQGDIRIVPCPAGDDCHADPPLPFHALSFCENHCRWEPMPDGHPKAAPLIAEATAEAAANSGDDDHAEDEVEDDFSFDDDE